MLVCVCVLRKKNALTGDATYDNLVRHEVVAGKQIFVVVIVVCCCCLLFVLVCLKCLFFVGKKAQQYCSINVLIQ